MPNVLWTIFQKNRHLLHGLPALGAGVIQQWMKAKYGVRVLLMVVPHTFGRHLTFNAHLHILVSAGGLKEAEVRWIPKLPFNKRALMHIVAICGHQLPPSRIEGERPHYGHERKKLQSIPGDAV
jgi:hypothetical protein